MISYRYYGEEDKKQMKIVNIPFLFLFFLLFVRNGFSQNDFFFNHYMFNPSYYNPAWVGVENKAFLAVHHRTQWTGYKPSIDIGSAPSTQLISLVIPTDKKISGIGFLVSNDRIGPLSSIQARLSVSLKHDFKFGQLSLGIAPAINIQSLDPDFRAVDLDDNLIPTNKESQIKPNLHAGIFFKTRKDHFIGFSIANILTPKFDYSTDAENKISINYILLGGTSLGLIRDLVLNPTIIIRSDLNTYTYDISLVTVYQEKIWGGIAFKKSEALSLLLGYSFLKEDKLKAGYSFDYVIKDREAKQRTSHEIFLRYELPRLIIGKRKIIKTPRFVF